MLKVHKQSAMTLLEVLIAMTLMVIISAISFASLNGLIDAKNHTDKVANKLRTELLISQQLNKDIAGLIQRSVKDEFGSTKAAVIGRYSSLEFSRMGHDNPLNQNKADMLRVHWYVRDHKLYRRTLNYLDVGNFSKWQERQYMDEIAELNINFINTAGAEFRTWPIENSISPLQAIAFNIVFKDRTTLKYFLSLGK